MIDLDELEKLCNAATPGPFCLNHFADARFLAACRTAVPELIAEVRRLKDLLEVRTNSWINTTDALSEADARIKELKQQLSIRGQAFD